MTAIAKEFDPNQPRDDHGRWTDIANYTAGGWESINPHLRAGKRSGVASRMSTEIRRSKLPKAAKFYSGIEGFTKHYGNLSVGQRFIDKGFRSTSSNFEVSTYFGVRDGADFQDETDVILEIQMRKGQSILDVSPHTLNDPTKTVSGLSEDEWLLPHGTEFEVVGFKTIKDEYGDPWRVLQVKVVEQVKRKKRRKRISKANPLWDGDGVQGAGQPRDRHGRWIALPGPTSISRIGSFDLEGTKTTRIGVFVDDERRPIARFRSKKAANEFVAEKIKEDAKAFANNRRAVRRQNRKMEQESERRRADREAAAAERVKEQNRRQRQQERLIPAKKIPKAKPVGVEQKGPKPDRENRRITRSPIDRLDVPGRPTQAQANDAGRWARQNMPDSEAAYAGLIIRLLKNRGVTQDPSMRHQMSERYKIPAGRLVQIEQDVYDHMFPPENKEKAQRARNLRGGSSKISPKQVEVFDRSGATSAFPEADPDTTLRPSRYFRIKRGPQRGRWALVDWNGHVNLVTDKKAAKERSDSKVYWTKRLLKNQKLRPGKERKADEKSIRNESIEDKKARRIRIARAWAEQEGYDPDDSYWWMIYWNDTSLLSSKDDGESTYELEIALADPEVREMMDPAELEAILAMPDIDSRKMRGHKPGPRYAISTDEDFEEASALSREVSVEHEDRLARQRREHDRRMRAAYEKYKKKHPNSRISFEGFVEDRYHNKMRIPGGKRVNKRRVRICKANPLWEGDKFQPPGQPRNRRGEFSRTRGGSALSRAAGTAMRASSVFDDRRKTIAEGQKIKRPQKGATHQQMAAGKPVKRTSRNITPEKAYYERNNGSTAISDKRLKEIYEDRGSVTPQEHDLITAAAGDVNFDGNKLIKFKSVRAGGAQASMPRWEMFKNLRTQLAQDYAKSENLGDKGGRGHQRINTGEKARAQNVKDSQKRIENGRNIWSRDAKKKELLLQFGDGKRARCIICGKWVTALTVSPERIKPGGQNQSFGGIYEDGNVAPSHQACNKATGNAAQYKPEQYYEDNLERFLKYYDEWIQQGYLWEIFKHHPDLRGKWPKGVRRQR